MKTALSFRSFLSILFVTVISLFTITVFSQAWTFRNGFGQSGAANGFADFGKAVCTDASGNVYITGKISDDLTGNTVSFGGTALVSAGDDDGFVAKFNSSGVHQWSLRFGGTLLDDGGLGIATDGTSVFVVGGANGTMTVGTSATNYAGAGTAADGVIMKLDATTGSVTWVTRFGGNNADLAQAVAIDGSGNVYVSGIFRTRTANPTATFGSFTRTVQGNGGTYTSDLFVAQLNSSGTFTWVSTGGISGSNDNINGSGICYVASLTEVIVTGNFRTLAGGSTTATYSTTSPASSVVLTNSSSATVNEDFCLLEVNASSGAFVSGSGVGSADGNEAGLGITYDSYTGDAFFAGYFSSSSVTFPGNAANANGSAMHDNILYGRYNPTTDAYTWVKDADNSAAASAADVARAITSDGYGGVLITGNFRNTATFPGGSTVIASGLLSDIFLARINVANGNAVLLTQGTGTNTLGDDIGYGIAYASNGNNIWITGQYLSSITFSPLAALASNNNKEDVVVANYNNPIPTISAHPSPSTSCAGLPVSFSVAASGTNLTYQWQESSNAGFTSPTNLTNSGVYSNVTTATLNISDNSTLNGKYYRAVVTNLGGTINSNGALLTVTTPILPTGNVSIAQSATTANNYYYGSSCQLITRVVPSGGTPISGTVTAETWREASVPTYGGLPYVQRHFQVTPSAGSTATVTLYFSQQDFDNFNAVSGVDLPTGPADATGKANMRISKLNGSSNNGTGLPGSYTSGGILIDPADGSITWNSTYGRWEVSFIVTGFSGFFVQTATVVLPLKLISFSAQKSGDDVQLKWQTADETDNDHFEIERSLDGRTFAEMGQRTANNGTGVKNYDWLDAGVIGMGTSKIFYRLRIVGLSGSVDYSNTIVVYLNKQAIVITGVMPNPFTDKLNIGLNMPASGKVLLKLTDLTGRIIHRESLLVPKGFSTYVVKGLDKVTAGLYILSAEYEGQVSIYKVKK